MASIKKKRVRWTPASDIDITHHRVVVAPEGTELTEETEPYVDVIMPTAEIILPDNFPEGTFSGDMNYFIGIFAVDDVGNTSDMNIVSSPLDFTAPGAPTNVIVENF